MSNDIQKIQSVLILHADASQLRGLIEQQHPNVKVFYAETSAEVEPMLELAQPEAVFSINDAKLPSDCLRMAGQYRSVKWYHVGGSGIDRMLPWSSTFSVMSNGAGVLAQYLAETVLGAILAMNNNLHTYHRQQLNKEWIKHQFKPICEQTLLIVGLGAVGKKVADNAKALGMRVIATRKNLQPYKNVDRLYSATELPDIVGEADFVSLHLPLSDETTHLFNRDMISRMKAGACLINTARGPVVEEQALISALASSCLKAAYIDVFKQEPLVQESPLWEIENLILTPHMADGVFQFEQKYLQFFSDNLLRWNQGDAIKNKITFID